MTDDRFRIEACCDLCGATRAYTLFTKEGFPHVRCERCGFVFVHPLRPNHLEGQCLGGTAMMGDDAPTPAHVKRLRRELRVMAPFRSLNRLLEIGPGRGWFLDEAAKSGWETWAVEVNQDAVRRLESAKLHKVVALPAEDARLPPDSIDIVRIWDVIEHLPSPRTALLNAAGALRPGGLLRLATTNFASLSRWINGPEWVYLNGADHVSLFEPATITRLLESVGLSVRTVSTRSFNLRRKLYHPERELPAKLPWLKPFRKLIDVAVGATPFGHQMIVTAIKVST